MKFLHISDLHLGKSIYGLSLIESGDQPAWVESFLEIAAEIQPDAVVIAGDIYDRSNPSGDAMELFDHMLTELNNRNIPVLMISGNHDSGQRVGFAGSMLAKNNVYIAGTAEKEMKHVTITGEDGDEVTFWLMPYVFPALVAQKLEDRSLKDYEEAVKALIAAQNIDFSKKNVLVAHQTVTANGQDAVRGGSETMVGGVGQIDYSVFDGFDYVALGHIHAAYSVGRPEVRYAGSPLCYHFDETKQPKKGPVLVAIGEKKDGCAQVETEVVEIPPLHPLRVIEGPFEEIRLAEEKNLTRSEYVSITLTDRRTTPEISDYFSSLFESRNSHVMELLSSYEEQSAVSGRGASSEDVASKSMKELFSDFYSFRKGGIDVSEQERQALSFAEQLADEKAGSIGKDGITSTMNQDIDRLIDRIMEIAEADQ